MNTLDSTVNGKPPISRETAAPKLEPTTESDNQHETTSHGKQEVRNMKLVQTARSSNELTDTE